MGKVKISEKLSAGLSKDKNGQRNLELLVEDVVDFENNKVRSCLKVSTEYIGENDEPVYSTTITLSPSTVAALKDYLIAFLAGEKSTELDFSDDGA
jgi:hypothetical protein